MTTNLKEKYSDSFIKNNNVNDFGVEISIMPKWKIFWFQKTSFGCYGFSIVGKGAYITRMGTGRNCSAYTII